MVGFPYLYWFLPVTRAVTLSMLFLLEGKLVFNQAEDWIHRDISIVPS